MREQRILIVDDHPIVRGGLAQFANQQLGLTVCAEAGDAHEALKAARETSPDVVVLDISLGHSSGLALIPELKAISPGLSILVLSMHDEFLYAERALRAGASGYIMKDASTDKVIDAIRHILRGEIYLSPEMSRRLLGRMVGKTPPSTTSPVSALTDRELQIFEMIGRGRRSVDIAADLHVSIKTVEAHRANIKSKLKLGNHIELLQMATNWIQMPSP